MLHQKDHLLFFMRKINTLNETECTRSTINDTTHTVNETHFIFSKMYCFKHNQTHFYKNGYFYGIYFLFPPSLPPPPSLT